MAVYNDMIDLPLSLFSSSASFDMVVSAADVVSSWPLSGMTVSAAKEVRNTVLDSKKYTLLTKIFGWLYACVGF